MAFIFYFGMPAPHPVAYPDTIIEIIQIAGKHYQ
jgi:hypothetical protein